MSSPVPAVSVAEVPPGAVLLDVREDDEWQAGRAPGAVHLAMSRLPAGLDALSADDDVVVVCRSGHRSAQVTAYLAQNGWRVRNLDGGMLAWQAAGRPMEADGPQPPQVV